ncbi:MAG: FtsW/RodA/SpoVE family cell cycle protein [Coriobacteriales bacterium]|nr:FtsW/RodA/SpoVE family cell cycle protein [Coriobacteriales bacterium]
MSTRRSTELWLLLAAIPILFILFLSLLINDNKEITFASLAVPISLIILFIVAHIIMRFFCKDADATIIPIIFALAGIGICFVLRLAPEDTALKQIVWLVAAIICMILVIILLPSIEKISQYKYTCLLIGVILLILPLIPGIGAEYNGSKIWLSIAGFSFQPGEIAKIFIVLFLAAYLSDNRELLSTVRRTKIGLGIPHFRTLIPLIVMWLLALLIVIFEKDLGSALLFFGIFLVMIYVCTGKLSYIAIGLILTAVGGVFLYFFFGHVQSRIQIWLDPFSDPSGAGYQLVQSLYSLADGGLFGTGIGRGMPDYIPEVMSDFIFSAIAEEMGLLGAASIIILFMLFAVRSMANAARAKSDFAAFLVVGLCASICLQAFLIIGGVIGLIPLTGLTLPFMSQGGSSLLSSFIIIGIILKVSNESTGLETELSGTMQYKKHQFESIEAGVLGRSALGKRLTVIIAVFTILFALEIGYITYIQVFKAQEIKNMSGNNHTIAKESTRQRGTIYTSDNTVLAYSKQNTDGTYSRLYPSSTLAAHATGYFSQKYGQSGVEKDMSHTLVGDQNFSTFTDALRSYAGIQNPGNDVTLTINSKVQQSAESVLSGVKGACVVLDTSTGAILAEASSPSFDLNNIDSLLSGKEASDDGALVNRATGALYAPGSTFKSLTLSAAIDSNTVKTTDQFDSPAVLDIGGGQVTNFNKEGHGRITVEQATKVSSNTVFAQVADKLSPKKLVEYSEKFGINNDFALDFSLTKSLMPDYNEMTTWENAWSGVGQPVGEHSSPAGPQVTVMQMAAIMQAISNDGCMIKPYIVSKVTSPNGNIVSVTKSDIYNQVISKSNAKLVQDVLEQVVLSGTGTAAQISDARVIGKTGTAETGKPDSDAWFIGTATKNGKSVTIAIVIEQGKSGGSTAAPKAKTVLETALNEIAY